MQKKFQYNVIKYVGSNALYKAWMLQCSESKKRNKQTYIGAYPYAETSFEVLLGNVVIIWNKTYFRTKGSLKKGQTSHVQWPHNLVETTLQQPKQQLLSGSICVHIRRTWSSQDSVWWFHLAQVGGAYAKEVLSWQQQQHWWCARGWDDVLVGARAASTHRTQPVDGQPSTQ